MLILVTVTVTASINGGLFGFAKQAKDQTEIAEEKGALNTSVITAMAKSRYGNTLQIEHLETTLNANVGDGKTEVLDNVETIVVKFNTSNRYYEIDSNGNIEGPLEIIFDATPGALDGTGTEEDPFIIMSIEDLVYFSKKVNEGTNYSGKYVELGKTLDFKSDLSYININTTEYDVYLGGDGTTGLKEQLTNGKGFRPIGDNTSATFKGKFDGKIYEIKNIYENVETVGGLFGCIWYGGSKENSIVIKNVVISGNINATSYAGGVIGAVYHSYAIIENIINNVNVTASNNSAGGIIGRADGSTGIMEFNKCFNYGNITSVGATGGIVGGGNEPTVKIYNSYNCGNLLGGSRVGGIYGHSATNSKRNVLANVFNVGKAEKYGWTPGGLAGQDSQFAKVINSYYISIYKFGIGWGSVVAGTQYTEEQMKASNFVDELNTNIENGCPYEQENEDGTVETITIDTTGWAKWVYNENSYPTLDTTTIWNGTEWVKE